MDHVFIASLSIAFVHKVASRPLTGFVHFSIQCGEKQILQDCRIISERIR